MHVGHLAVGVRVLDNGIAEAAERRVGRPEGAENDVGGGRDALLGDDLVGDFID